MIANRLCGIAPGHLIAGTFLGWWMLSGFNYPVGRNIMDEITSKLSQFIKDKLGVEESAITADASFYDDLDVDSLDFCELIVDIEKAFAIDIPADMYEKLRTVGGLVKYVSKKVEAKTGNTLHAEPELERLSA